MKIGPYIPSPKNPEYWQAVERLGLDAKKLSGIPYARSVYKEVGLGFCGLGIRGSGFRVVGVGGRNFGLLFEIP